MNLSLPSKPDAEVALDLMERWWLRENDERAILSIGIDTPPLPETKTYHTERERWLDFDYRVDRALAEVDRRTYFAETFPFFEPNLGPDIVSTLFGLDLEFHPDTSWGTPIVETVDQVLAIEPNFDAPLWAAVEKLQAMAIEAGRGRWITLFTDLHPNIDVPSALMGPQDLCMAIADDPELVEHAVKHVTKGCLAAYERQVAPLVAENLPIGCWMRALSRTRTHAPQCDFSAMVGPAYFERSILPSIREEMALAERNIYHLDGPDALRHLDALLDVPEIDAIQWVYGAGNGPARRWESVYRQILAAGKGVRVEAEDVEDIRVLDRALGPAGVWYVANFSAPDLEMAEKVLAILQTR
ncbi:MAG: hypothetical protein P4L46_01715 [Fimbriimonas sp.]|nr:hypothetical protein [Fimbriimonas sp.]